MVGQIFSLEKSRKIKPKKPETGNAAARRGLGTKPPSLGLFGWNVRPGVGILNFCPRILSQNTAGIPMGNPDPAIPNSESDRDFFDPYSFKIFKKFYQFSLIVQYASGSMKTVPQNGYSYTQAGEPPDLETGKSQGIIYIGIPILRAQK